MSGFPALSQHLARHRETTGYIFEWECLCGVDGRQDGPSHAEHQDAEWTRACTVSTVGQLDAFDFPMGTTIQEIHTGDCCTERFCDFYPPKWEMAHQCGWTRVGAMFDPDSQTPRFPVLLIWTPGAQGA